MREDIINWLLEGEPWVVYRTLIDLLNRDKKDKDILTAKKAIARNKFVKKIFKGQKEKGYWIKPETIYDFFPKKDSIYWRLSILADFGFTVKDKRIKKACDYIFSVQTESGGFIGFDKRNPFDCHTAHLITLLAKLGLVTDKRIEKAYNWLLPRQRLDGGWFHSRNAQTGKRREKEPSCPQATLSVLEALVQHPTMRNSEFARKCVEFLLGCWERKGRTRSFGIGTEWRKLKYPYTQYQILRFADCLSQFEFAKRDLRMNEIFDLLISKQDENGRFVPESIHKIWEDFDFGQKKCPSRWITFLVYTIEKRLSKHK